MLEKRELAFSQFRIEINNINKNLEGLFLSVGRHENSRSKFLLQSSHDANDR